MKQWIDDNGYRIMGWVTLVLTLVAGMWVLGLMLDILGPFLS